MNSTVYRRSAAAGTGAGGGQPNSSGYSRTQVGGSSTLPAQGGAVGGTITSSSIQPTQQNSPKNNDEAASPIAEFSNNEYMVEGEFECVGSICSSRAND